METAGFQRDKNLGNNEDSRKLLIPSSELILPEKPSAVSRGFGRDPSSGLFLRPAAREALVVPGGNEKKYPVGNKIVRDIFTADHIEKEPDMVSGEIFRSQAEEILAIHDLQIYLRERFLKSEGDSEYAKEIGERLGSLDAADAHPELESPMPFSDVVLRRKIKMKDVRDPNTGERIIENISYPGILERAGILLLNEAGDVFIQQSKKTEGVVSTLYTLLRTYRLNVDSQEAYLPEMPDLVAKAIELLPSLTHAAIGERAKAVRFELYDALREITLPISIQESLIENMDAQGDLEHPLASEIVIFLASKNPEHSFLREQQKRREELLSFLGGSPSEIFGAYQTLDAAARRLVLSHDFSKYSKGKTGQEIEFVCEHAGRSIPPGWTVNFGGDNYFELGKDEKALSYDLSWIEDSAKAVRWMRDYACANAYTMHIHLDRKEHPHAPTLGNLLPISFGMIKKNDLNTWEIRANSVPLTPRGISLPSWLGLVELYQYDGKNVSKKRKFSERIALSGSETYAELIWGHIITSIQEPEARLSAIFALRYPKSFRAINDVAFLATYRDEDQSHIKDILNKEKIESELSRLEKFLLADAHTGPDLINNLLQDSDQFTIEATVLALGEHLLNYPDKIRDLLRNHSERVVAATLSALGEHIWEYPEEIANLLHVKNKNVVADIVSALGEHLSEYPEEIRGLLQSPNEFLVLATLSALGEHIWEYQESNAAINRLLKSKYQNVIKDAISILGKYPREYPEEIRGLLQSPNEFLVLTTLSALGEHIREYPGEITNLLHHLNEHVILTTLSALGEHLSEYPEEIRGLLQNPNELLVAATLSALGEHIWEYQESNAAINRLLKSTHPDVVGDTISALGKHLPEYSEEIRGLLQNPNALMVKKTISVLGENIREYPEEVDNLLHNQNKYLAAATLSALGEHIWEYPESNALIDNLLRSWNEDVAMNVISILGKNIKKINRNSLIFLGKHKIQSIRLMYQLTMMNADISEK